MPTKPRRDTDYMPTVERTMLSPETFYCFQITKKESMESPLSWDEIPTPILFHSTDIQNLKSIQTTGLCPSTISQIVTWKVSDPDSFYVEVNPQNALTWSKDFSVLLAILKSDIPRQCKAYRDWNLTCYDSVEAIAVRGQAYAITNCGCITPDRLWILTTTPIKRSRRFKYLFKRLTDVKVPTWGTGIVQDYDRSIFVDSVDGLGVHKIIKPFINPKSRWPSIAPLAELFGISESEMRRRAQ